MKKHLNTIVAAMLLTSTALAPAAFAQTTTAPATGTEAPLANDAVPATNTPAVTSETSSAVTNSGDYLVNQTSTQISANDFIGQPVYNAANETIGDINDLIIEENGGIVAAVVGVGGFLGIAEKNVAVPMSKITVTRTTDSNDVKLTTMETAELLKAAPEFKTLDAQRDASATAPADATTTSSTKP